MRTVPVAVLFWVIVVLLLAGVSGAFRALALRDAMTSDLISTLILAVVQLLAIGAALLAAGIAWRGVQRQIDAQLEISRIQRASSERFKFFEWQTNADRMLLELVELAIYVRTAVNWSLAGRTDPDVAQTRGQLGHRVETILRQTVPVSYNGRLKHHLYQPHLDYDVISPLVQEVGRITVACDTLRMGLSDERPRGEDHDVQKILSACDELQRIAETKPQQRHGDQVQQCEDEIADAQARLLKLRGPL